MDFQRLFKRKEEDPAPPTARDNVRETVNARDVLVCEGELLDGTKPACLVWSSVGGAIRVKADKILGILEGRTRIKAAALQELYPALFEKAPNPGTEFNIPLQAVVMQLEDLFTGLAAEELFLEDFDTPFGRLAREDEAKLKDEHPDRSDVGPRTAPQLFTLPQPGLKPDPNEQDQSAGREMPKENGSTQELKEKNPSSDGKSGSDTARQESQNHACRPELTNNPSIEKLVPASDPHSARSGTSASSSAARKIPSNNSRREAHVYLQELYLTDESLDGSKVAEMILQLPRVAGVVILLSDGAALGGGLCGGLGEALLSLTPDFVKYLLDFTKSMQGGPVNFVTFSGHACQVSLTIDGDVLILASHEGKNLPPGLRERLVATAQALNMIYSSKS